MRLIRVFPHVTRALPRDELAAIDRPPGFFDEADEVHISVVFSWDVRKAEMLEKQWRHVAPTKIGGPATGMRGEGFVPGRYLKPGYVITSRGCPNRCWFCTVWQREGQEVRELPIAEGFNVLDDNLLAGSEQHVRAVFAMLKSQRLGRPQFTGGLEAARLKPWHVDLLADLRPKQLFFAYDTPDDLEPLRKAGRMLAPHFTAASKSLRAYVLGAYPGDTREAWTKRLEATQAAGFWPAAMMWREPKAGMDVVLGPHHYDWKRLQRQWARPAMMHREGR